MSRPTAQIENETEDDEANDCEDLDRRKPKLAFTKSAGAKGVDDDDDDTGYSNPCCVIYIMVPVYRR